MDFEQIVQQDNVEWMKEYRFYCGEAVCHKLAEHNARKCLDYAMENGSLPDDINITLINNGYPCYTDLSCDGELEAVILTRLYRYLKMIRIPTIDIAYKLVATGNLSRRLIRIVHKLYKPSEWRSYVHGKRIWKMFEVGAIPMLRNCAISPFMLLNHELDDIKSLMRYVLHPVIVYIYPNDTKLKEYLFGIGVYVHYTKRKKQRQTITITV